MNLIDTKNIELQPFNVKWIEDTSSSIFKIDEGFLVATHAEIEWEKLNPSDNDKLFGLEQKAPTWASFCPPDLSERSLKTCFDKQIVPDLDLEESLELYAKTERDASLDAFFFQYEELSFLMNKIMVEKARFKKG